MTRRFTHKLLKYGIKVVDHQVGQEIRLTFVMWDAISNPKKHPTTGHLSFGLLTRATLEALNDRGLVAITSYQSDSRGSPVTCKDYDALSELGIALSEYLPPPPPSETWPNVKSRNLSPDNVRLTDRRRKLLGWIRENGRLDAWAIEDDEVRMRRTTTPGWTGFGHGRVVRVSDINGFKTMGLIEFGVCEMELEIVCRLTVLGALNAAEDIRGI